MSNFFFSPYGVLPGEYKEKGLDDKAVMKHWRPNDPEEQRISSFQAWQKHLLSQISEYIWPTFEPGTDTWIGKSVNTAKDLTELELEVMILEFMTTNKILDAYPSSALAVPNIESHLQHYQYEDQDAPGVNFRQYDKTLGGREEELLLLKMLSAVTTRSLGVGEKIAGHFWFKSELQRPRPLHAALRLKLERDFVSVLSSRGQHPSIVSGHCLQGIMMCCSVLENWQENNAPIDRNRLDSLAQYMVDVGDRRVFAGVHYPSDSIASWGVALSLIPEVFSAPTFMADFVRDAIFTKSLVYHVVKKHYLSDPRAKGTIEFMNMHGLLAVAA